MSSSFQPRRHRVASPAAPPGRPSPALGAELAALRLTTLRLSRRFAVANGVLFAVILLFAGTGGRLLGTEVLGRLNLGMVLGLFEGVLLLATAAQFDRRSTTECDRTTDGLRARYDGLSGLNGLNGPDGLDDRSDERDDRQYGERSDTWDGYLYGGGRPHAGQVPDSWEMGR